jgi:hypothetical protein
VLLKCVHIDVIVSGYTTLGMSEHDVAIRLGGWYPMIVVYRRPMDLTEHLMQKVAGSSDCEFTHCELFLPDSGGTFTIFKGGYLSKFETLPMMYNTRPELFAWHMIPLNYEEYVRMHLWNTVQISHRCPYNFRDLLWQMAPRKLRYSCVNDLAVPIAHNPTRMFCSQAIILALREASNGIGSRQMLKQFVGSSNSRLVSPSDLSCMVTEYLGVDIRNTLVPTTTHEIEQCLRNAVEFASRRSLMYDSNTIQPTYHYRQWGTPLQSLRREE